MVIDIISSDYGWLHSPDGTESAQVLFKARKAREGYFTCKDIIKQASKAMDILEQRYPDEDHVIAFDNASTHLKHANDALSARHMPKFSPRGKDKWDGTNWGDGWWPTNWGVEVNVVDENGEAVHGTNGAPFKKQVPMGDGKFADGSPQSLNNPESHKHAGVFKGMEVILEEQGYEGALKIRAECPKFQCDKEK